MKSSTKAGEITLEELTEDTLEFVRQVRSDPEVYKWLWDQRPVTEAQQQHWWDEYHTSNHSLYVGILDGVPMGYGQLRFRGRTAELGLCVERTHRESGLGHVLLRALLRQGKVVGCEWVWVHLFFDNQRAIRLYRGCGFRLLPLEQYPKVRGDNPVPTLVMVRSL